MGRSVYSSFHLPSLESERMTLKTMVFLCIVLVGFIEAWISPNNGYANAFGDYNNEKDSDNIDEDLQPRRKKRSVYIESSEGSTDGDDVPTLTGVDAGDTITDNNDDSEDASGDGEQVDSVDPMESRKRREIDPTCQIDPGWCMK